MWRRGTCTAGDALAPRPYTLVIPATRPPAMCPTAFLRTSGAPPLPSLEFERRRAAFTTASSTIPDSNSLGEPSDAVWKSTPARRVLGRFALSPHALDDPTAPSSG